MVSGTGSFIYNIKAEENMIKDALYIILTEFW